MLRTDNYRVKFHHVEFAKRDKNVPGEYRAKRGTIAKIYPAPAPGVQLGEPIVVGWAACSPKEKTFNKAIGRFLSLFRALQIHGFDRAAKKEIMNAFWETTPPSKVFNDSGLSEFDY
jgi:hypothetical protein